MQPAIRHAERGYRATPYLVEAVTETAADLARFPETARTFLPGGAPIKAGDLVVLGDYAATLRLIAAKGPDALYGGELGAVIADHFRANGGIITLEDLAHYQTVERRPVRGTYRGFEITGPPPPTAGGLHLVEMLNILEGFDVAALGFGTTEYFHLVAEVLKLGFADRNACTGDPAFVDVPVARLVSKDYAATRRAEIRQDRAGVYGAPASAPTSAHTTHVTTADADGNVVAMTQTINNLFGAKATVPGTGVLLNNTMALFDPHPGHPASVAPAKRVTSSMAPTIVLRDGRPVWALGLPGGVRIFTSVFQALVNLIDHRMSLQEAVEAPRVWTQGQDLEMEHGDPGGDARRGGRAWASRGRGPRGGRRHERDRVRVGRLAPGRRLLARRRHAHRRQRGPRPRRHSLPSRRGNAPLAAELQQVAAVGGVRRPVKAQRLVEGGGGGILGAQPEPIEGTPRRL